MRSTNSTVSKARPAKARPRNKKVKPTTPEDASQTTLATHGEEHTLPLQQQLDEVAASGVDKCNMVSKDNDIQQRISSSKSSDGQLLLGGETEIEDQCYGECAVTLSAEDGTLNHSDGTPGKAGSCQSDAVTCDEATECPTEGTSSTTEDERMDHACTSMQCGGDDVLQENCSSNGSVEQQHHGTTDFSPGTLQDIANGNFIAGFGDRATIRVYDATGNEVHPSVNSNAAENVRYQGGQLEVLDNSLKDGANREPSVPLVNYADTENSAGAISGTNSGACATADASNSVIIATAVTQLNELSTEDLLPKVLIDHDTSNMEDEPFEIHINPLDSESSPEHSDSSTNAKQDDMPLKQKQTLETVTDDEDPMISEVPKPTSLSKESELCENRSFQIPELPNGIACQEMQDTVETLSQTRNSNSTSPSSRLAGETLTSSRTLDPNGTGNLHIPDDALLEANKTESNQDSHQETVDTSMLSSSTLSPNESVTLTASALDLSPTVTSVQVSFSHNVELHEDSKSTHSSQGLSISCQDSVGKSRPTNPSPSQRTPAKDSVQTEKSSLDCDGDTSRGQEGSIDDTPSRGDGLKRADGVKRKGHNHPISSLRTDINQVCR